MEQAPTRTMSTVPVFRVTQFRPTAIERNAPAPATAASSAILVAGDVRETYRTSMTPIIPRSS